jgi:primosomal protein N' (replication factor Y)
MSERYACSWGEALGAVLPAPLKRETGSRKVSMISAMEGVGKQELDKLETAHPKRYRLLRELIELDEPTELRGLLRRLNLSDSPAKTLVKAGLAQVIKVEALPDGMDGDFKLRGRPDKLSPAQEMAGIMIDNALRSEKSTTFLLEGVTGSGKTEVYLRAIETALAMDRAAIILVPEIALTPQTVSWFRSRFGEVCVLHSGLTDAQRLWSWRRLQRGEVRVVVGARSALFAPIENLGVVVVDEEHEPSFKQESIPRYHARDVAVERARRAGAICILGSATPSLESQMAAGAGTYKRLALPERVGGGSKPTVHVVDMRLESDKKKGQPLFSRMLKSMLHETVEAGEQVILFLNRRGFIPVLWCAGCEESVRCNQCDMGLTYHRRIKRLVCHSCCEEHPLPNACPRCTKPGLRFLGMGSERVEAELRELMDGVRVTRMDSDTMRKRTDYEDALGAFERHETDVIVGTQMIAKGLDFPRVTLVGIISADSALHLPDFRAAERTFQLIAQVAGRAGRSTLPGRVVVQTMMPEHSAIRHGADANYRAFVTEEAELRKELNYPPFGRLLRLLFEDEDEQCAKQGAERLAEALKAQDFAPALYLLGPAPAPMALVRGRHRLHILIKFKLEDPNFALAVDWLCTWSAKEPRPKLKIDVDPMSLM